MADLKISQFVNGNSIQPTDEIATNRAGVNTKVYVGSAAALDVGSAIGDLIAWQDDGGGNPLYPFGNGQNITNISASNVEYDNSVTNLPASNVQDAIDFLYDRIDPLSRIDIIPSYRFKATAEQDDPLLDFERSTVANRINARGLIQQVGIDEIRHQYSPSSWNYLGWLIERGRTQEIPYPKDLQEWTIGSQYSVSDSSALGPDGQMSLQKIIPSSGVNSFHTGAPQVTVSKTASAQMWTYVQDFRIGEMNSVRMRLWGTSTASNTSVTFNFATGNVTPFSVTGGFAHIDNGIIDLGNGLFRAFMTVTTDAAASLTAQSYAYRDGSPVNPSNGTDGIHVGFSNLYQGRITSFIDADGAATSRADDQASYTLPEAVTEGTIYFEGRSLDVSPSSNNNGHFFSISDGSADNLVSIRKATSGNTNIICVVGGTVYSSSTVNIPINTLFRGAISWGIENGVPFLRGSINGVPVTFASMPSTINPMSILRIGSYSNGANVNNGMISGDNAYYYRSLNQDQLNIITAL